VVEHLLECNLTVQFRVEGDEDGAQAPAGMRPEHAEAEPVGGGRAYALASRAIVVVVTARRSRGDMGDRGRDVCIGQPSEALACGTAGGNGGKALLHVAAVASEVCLGQSFEQGSVRRVEVP